MSPNRRSLGRGKARIIEVAVLALIIGSLSVGRATADGAQGGLFVPLSPDTIANTSNGNGLLGSTPFAAGETRSMTVAGQGGIPSSGVSAAVLEMVASNQTTAGELSLYPDDASLPSTTDLSFDAVNKASGFAVVELGADGGISVTSLDGNPNVIITVEGYFSATAGADAPGGYSPVNETRILDRTSTQLAGGETTTVQVGGSNGVPSDAGAAFVNVAASSATASGGVFVWPDGTSMPNAATLRWTPGLSSTGAIVALGSSGSVDVYNSGSQAVSLTIDLDGYFAGGTPSGGSFFTADDRLLDTTQAPASSLGANQTASIQVAGAALDLPAAGINSVALNVTVTHSTAVGTLRLWPTGTSEPSTTSANYDAGAASSALNITALGSDGTVTVRNLGSAAVDVTVDTEGWFTNSDFAPAAYDGTDSGGSIGNQTVSGPNTPSCGYGSFATKGDYVHISSTDAYEASGHGWWTNYTCTAATQAKITIYLQEWWKDSNGNGFWWRKGTTDVETVYSTSTGGNGQHASGRAHCDNILRPVGWSSVVDADLVGVNDPPDKLTTTPRNINCVRTSP